MQTYDFSTTFAVPRAFGAWFAKCCHYGTTHTGFEPDIQAVRDCGKMDINRVDQAYKRSKRRFRPFAFLRRFALTLCPKVSENPEGASPRASIRGTHESVPPFEQRSATDRTCGDDNQVHQLAGISGTGLAGSEPAGRDSTFSLNKFGSSASPKRWSSQDKRRQDLSRSVGAEKTACERVGGSQTSRAALVGLTVENRLPTRCRPV